MKTKLQNLKGVIFDFDGTLVSIHIDFKGMKDKLLERAAYFGFKMPDKNIPMLEILEYISRNNKENKNTQNFISEIERMLIEEEVKSAEKAVPLQGSIQLMKDLREEGIKIGIFTRNCGQAVRGAMERCNIFCDALLTRDDVSKVKPAREHLEETANLLGLERDEFVVVGDHPMDIKCAKNLSALSCGITSEHFKKNDFIKEGADFVFNKIEDVGYLFGLKPLKGGKLPNCLLEYLLNEYIQNDNSVLVGPQVGVDSAIFKSDKKILFAKTDPITLVDKDIGNYLININVNDILVMGGLPRWLLCSLIFCEKTTFKEVENVFAQISYYCKKYDINWVGGHTEISSGVKNNVACGCLVGTEIEKKFQDIKQPVKVGDKVFLVKEIGTEAVSIISREKYGYLKEEFPENTLKKWLNTINIPGISIFSEAKLLWENFNIKSMHDPTEGGISTSLYELADRYGVGITIDKKNLIFNQDIIKLSSIFGLNPYGIISSGCIVGIIPETDSYQMVEFMRGEGVKCDIIGEVIEEKGVYLKDGDEEELFPVFEQDEITKL